MDQPGTVAIKRIQPYTYIFLRRKGSYQGIGKAVGALMMSLFRRGYQPGGPLCGVFYNSPREVPEAELQWELRMPLAGEVKAQPPSRSGIGVGRAEPSEVAATVHKGPYHTVGQTYPLILDWIARNGYQVAGPAQEVYLNDPRTTPEAELLTEVRLPVRRLER